MEKKEGKQWDWLSDSNTCEASSYKGSSSSQYFKFNKNKLNTIIRDTKRSLWKTRRGEKKRTVLLPVTPDFGWEKNENYINRCLAQKTGRFHATFKYKTKLKR